MKIFIAYKFSDEDKQNLRLLFEKLSGTLEESGHKTFIHFRDKEKWGEIKLSSKEIITGALNELRDCDVIFVVVTTPEKSEGLLLEAGYARALGKKIILVIKKDVRAIFLREIADSILEFENIEESIDKIKNI